MRVVIQYVSVESHMIVIVMSMVAVAVLLMPLELEISQRDERRRTKGNVGRVPLTQARMLLRQLE